MHNGAAVAVLREEIQDTIDSAAGMSGLREHCGQLIDALTQIETTVKSVGDAADPSLALANATLFLDAMGHVVIAWMWLKQAVAATRGLAQNNAADAAFYGGKLAATQFFYRYELPKTNASLALVAGLDSTCYDLTADQFTGS
jgi:butyryl-CoA dehydrogenase